MPKRSDFKLLAFLTTASVIAISCQPRSANTDTERTDSGANIRVQDYSKCGPTRNLSDDEAAGGHVLRKHVGRSDDELRERLERERNITGASTYTDRATAECAIGAAIAENQSRLQHWLEKSGGHANLVLDYDAPRPIGRSLNRGESQPRSCSHAIVVLRYDPPNSFHVLTSYPECRI